MILSRHRSRGFTLIELLVVITIIGILAGLAIPAVSKALDAARRAEAGTMVNQLRTALVSYQTEYGAWPSAVFPSEATVDSSNSTLYNILIGSSTTAGAGENPRRIVFMEFNTKILRSSISATNKTPVATGTQFVDPWHQAYRFQVDADYDNQITTLGDSQTPSPLNATVAIWSRGNQKTYDATTDKSKFITTWK